MTDREIEKYCVEQNKKCASKAKEVLEEDEVRYNYYAGQANAFLWIAAVIRQNREVTAH